MRPARLLGLIVSLSLLTSGILISPGVISPAQADTCCSFVNCFQDSDNDTYTIGGVSVQCANPGCPFGYRAVASTNQDCNDSNPTIGYIPEETCPATCGYAGCTACKADGLCGLKNCPATPACYSQAYYQSYYQSYYQGYYQSYYQGYYQPYYQSYYQSYYQPYYQSYYQGYYQSYYQGYYQGYYQPYYQSYYQGYYQSSYYSEGGYYSQGYYQSSYYSEGGYYSQGYYQSSYYAEGGY